MTCDKLSLFFLNITDFIDCCYNVNVSIELILKFEYDGQVNHLVF